jgi:hypothetical protein
MAGFSKARQKSTAAPLITVQVDRVAADRVHNLDEEDG